MALNGLTQGKNLKPFLCLVRNAYHDLFLTNPPQKGAKEVVLTRSSHVNRLKQAFPYYSAADLDNLFTEFELHAQAHGRNEIKQLYEYYFSGIYRDQAEFISSSRLYHFLSKRFLLTTLQKGFVYPSIADYEEFKCLFKLFQGNAQLEKEGVLQDIDFLKKWRGSNTELIDLRNRGASETEVNDFLVNTAFVPAYSCFTELNSSHITMHANHYGSYGISFEKNDVVVKKRPNNTVEPKNYIRPIHYCDNTYVSTPWILLDRIRKNSIDRSERMGLFADLLLIKPIHESLFHPEFVHSVMNEREWRYVSPERCFRFDLRDVHSVVISRSDYEKWLDDKVDTDVGALLSFCNSNDLAIEYV